MAFKKGQSGNEAGRPPGAVNRTTKEMREMISLVVSSQLEDIDAILDEVKEKDQEKYLDLLFKLMRFVIAQKTDVTTDDEKIKQPINIHVTDPRIGEELKKLLE